MVRMLTLAALAAAGLAVPAAAADAGAAGGRAGVRIKTAGGEATVLFDLAGEPGGHIKLPGPQKVDQELTRKVRPQSGLGADKP